MSRETKCTKCPSGIFLRMSGSVINGARGAPLTYGQLGVVDVVGVGDAISQRILNRFMIFFFIYTDIIVQRKRLLRLEIRRVHVFPIFVDFLFCTNTFPNLHTLTYRRSDLKNLE